MMAGRPAWMYRGHEEYDPNDIGDISVAKVFAALVEAGKFVLFPVQVRQYDLVFEDEFGSFFRVQCKTGQLIGGVVRFRPQSLRAANKETGWRRVVTTYEGKIDYFGVYCPDNGKVYLVPIKDVPVVSSFSMRVAPAKNNQQKGIHLGEDYELRPLTTGGIRKSR
jgi:hypothetical protein